MEEKRPERITLPFDDALTWTFSRFQGRILDFAVSYPIKIPEDLYDKEELDLLNELRNKRDDRSQYAAQLYEKVMRPFDRILTGQVSLRLPNHQIIYHQPVDFPELNPDGSQPPLTDDDYLSMTPTEPPQDSTVLATFNPDYQKIVRMPFSLGPQGHGTRELEALLQAYNVQHETEFNVEIPVLFGSMYPLGELAVRAFKPLGAEGYESPRT